MNFQSIVLLIIQFLLALFLSGTTGCRRDPAGEAEKPNARSPSESAAPTNRVEVPEAVRRNLGITFAKVESRAVAQTIRVPGRFELLPNARREYRTMLPGRVELLVSQYDRVTPGTPLYRLASPAWRELQEKLNDTESAIRQAEARVSSMGPLIAAHQQHEESLSHSVALWTERIAQLDKSRGSGVLTADEYALAQTSLATHRSQLAELLEKKAELEAQRVETKSQLDAARSKFQLLLSTAETLLGIDETELLKLCEPATHTRPGVQQHEGPEELRIPLWRELDSVEVRATAPGIVQAFALTNGAWATEGSLVLATVEPERIRFKARGMQSDLGRLRDGLSARVVPPKGGSIELQDTMEGTLTLGLGADADERTIELLVTPTKLAGWARPDVAGHLEIVIAGGESQLAIPLSSVIQDGLAKVFFRRDPKDPDKAIRMDADLGINDGRWVVVKSGLRDGDEVVLDGVYQLMLATSGSAQKGGHFHSDGTFHEGKD